MPSFVTEVAEVMGWTPERATKRAFQLQEQVASRATLRYWGIRARLFNGVSLVFRYLVAAALLELGDAPFVIVYVAVLGVLVLARRAAYELELRRSRYATAGDVAAFAGTLGLLGGFLAISRPGLAIVAGLGELFSWFSRRDIYRARELAGRQAVVV